MSEKGTVFQKGGGGTNFEQYIQAAFVVTMAVKGNAPCIPQNEIEEIVLQASNRSWETDDMLVIAKSKSGNHQLLVQAKHTLVFSEENETFNEVILAFWSDFNKPAFNKMNDRLLIIKNRLNNIEKNHIKGILNYAKTHSSETDFISEVNRIKEKKERLDIFRKTLKVANNNNAVGEKNLWEFLKCLDVLGYDFLNEGSVDETYILNLIKLSKNTSITTGEKEIWNSIITFITKTNPAGGSLTKETIKGKEFYNYFDFSRLEPVYKSVEKLLKDSEAILKPIKNVIGNSTAQFYISRPTMIQDIVNGTNESNFVIVTGKPGVGKSAVVKDIFAGGFIDSSILVFRADQFNRPHLANVLSDMGIHQSLTEVFACLSLIPGKIIFIDSLEKLLEDADPDNAFNQLLSLTKEKDIKVIGTSRKYAVELLIQKFGIEQATLKITEVLPLSDAELTEVAKHFPVLSNPLKNENIRSLLRSPKYLDFTIRSLALSSDDFTGTSITKFKEKLWNSLVSNASYRANGLPAKRDRTFMNIAVNRAKEMTLFIKATDIDEEAVDLLENDDIIFQDGTKRKYAPSHDILEDWALVKYVSFKYEDHTDIKFFFEELGNEPAIRRGFRLWVEDFMVDQPGKLNSLIKSSITNESIERYWADELLTAIFKSDNSKPFFTAFQNELLDDNARFLNRCLHLIKTSCKENNYSVGEKPVLLPIGSGWEEALVFINQHLTDLNHLRLSILSFLDNWDYRLIFQYPREKPELFAVRDIVLFYIGQIEKEDEFWMERSSESNQKLIISILLNLPSIVKDEITSLVKKALKEEDERSNWRLHSFYEKVLEKFLSGIGTQRIALVLPDLIIEAAWKHWKYAPPKLDENDMSFTRVMGDYIHRDHCWGINEKFGFFPSGIYKTPVYNLLTFHPVQAVKFITEFINYSVDFYVNAKCHYKHEMSEVNITMNDGTIVKQWAGWELWVAYRGISVTDYLLECLLMTLEKYLLDLASQKTETSRKTLKLVYNYLLRNSNSVMVTGVLSSVTIAYPTEVEEEMLPLVQVKEIFPWESARPLQENTALAPYDDHILIAQKIRWESNQLPHRTKYRRGFADFLVDYQLTIGTLNPRLIEILDKMWDEAQPDDVIWRKKLNEIDTRKWEVSKFEEGSGQFMIQPKYETAIVEFMSTGKEQMDAANKASGYSLKLSKVLDGKEQMDIDTWKEYFLYYSILEKIDILHDRPVTFAVIGLREFAEHLSGEELSWCVQTLTTTIGYIIGETNARNFSLSSNYNLMEKEVALHSFHLLFNVVEEEDNINELIFMMAYALIAPFAEHEIEKLTDYVRLTFAKPHPVITKKIWRIVIHCSRFKKENQYFYDDHDTNRLQAARKKEFEYVENLSKKGEIPPLDFSTITFINSRAHLLSIALCIMPYEENEEEYIQFLFRFVQLLAEDLSREDNFSYKRNKDRQLHHRLIFDIEKYLAELLLNAEIGLSKKVIDTLTSMAYKIKKTDLHKKADFLDFISKTLDLLVYKLDDFVSNDANKELRNIVTKRFWDLWNHLYSIVSKSKKDYFKSKLLFDTEISWPEERDHFSVLDGKTNQYKEMAYEFEETNIKSVIKILSTVGRKVFLPEGLVWITDMLKKYPEQINHVNTVACERLIKSLYYNHITEIKNRQALITNFIWLLDKMIDLGNSSAYLFRENVISYKKYN
ncbi:hypothetical protein [Agriterribacter sp.]|uniref:hypothetical protein n=1 Tax=Agriterribacter sp. TaxID=2821509 RepID=UPI002BA01150|nr:hypothetical protein [Agriterribacter sp.]HTN07600.1 hypothetical protein [Agriterribacter sp.]